MATRGKTRQLTPDDPFNGLGGSLLLHATTLALLVGWAIFTRSGRTWGSPSATPSTISATMVSSLPLPPKVIPQTENVLATETPSPAPIQAAPKTVAAPQPDAIPIPAPQAKPARQAARTTPPPPLHPQPTQVKPTQVQSGEAAANIPMSSVQTRAGTVSVTKLDLSDVHIRVYGDTAVVTSVADLVGSNGDSDISGKYRYTRVYARRRGGWKIVSFEASRVNDVDRRTKLKHKLTGES